MSWRREFAKEALTPASRKMLIDLGRILPGAESVTLELSELYEATRPLIDRSLALLERVFERLEARGIDPNNVRERWVPFYLIDGATAFPMVRQEAARALQAKGSTCTSAARSDRRRVGDRSRPRCRRLRTRSHHPSLRCLARGRSRSRKSLRSDLGQGYCQRVRGLPDRAFMRQPVHAVGHLRFLECSELGGDGRPEGDLTPWGDIYFPYDPRFIGEHNLRDRSTERCEGLSEQIVAEYSTTRRLRDGTVTVTIQNQTRGYQRRFVLGASGELAPG